MWRVTKGPWTGLEVGVHLLGILDQLDTTRIGGDHRPSPSPYTSLTPVTQNSLLSTVSRDPLLKKYEFWCVYFVKKKKETYTTNLDDIGRMLTHFTPWVRLLSRRLWTFTVSSFTVLVPRNQCSMSGTLLMP